MIPANIFAPLLPVLAVFEQLGVAYHIGGSVASSLWGVPRATLDADIVADLNYAHVTPLVTLLEQDYYIDGGMISAAIRDHGSFNLIHYETVFKIDIFVRKQEAFEESTFSRARRVPVGNANIVASFASPEDTLLHKLIWYKMGAEISERQWGDVIGILKARGDTLDYDYLRLWAERLAVIALLERALAALIA